ncbi:MAG: glycosyltransferase [Verrucomicrobiota bacterium]|nr:glycosyltransferase [Verrucomicrobiota bacterium]
MNQTLHPLQLLYWLSRSGGGISQAVRALSQSLEDSGARPSIVGLDDPFWSDDARQWQGLETKALPWSGPRAFGWCPKLPGTLAEAKPDLIHTHGLWMYYSLAADRYCERAKCPSIISPHGMLEPWALANSSWKKKLAGMAYEQHHLRNASCLHALNVQEMESIRAFGLKNPVAIIPNGVSLPDAPAAQPVNAKNKSHPHKLLFLGRIHPKKGLKELIDGWHLWRQQQPLAAEDWLLEIVGWDDGGHLDALILQAQEHFGSEHVTLPGQQPNAATHVAFGGAKFGEEKEATFRGASAFILPSYSEGLPMAVLEAWSHGLPVLMTDACHLQQGFDVNAAISLNPTATSIAHATEHLTSIPDQERHAMGARGRQLVLESYSWDRVAKSMQSVYRWTLGGGQRPDCVVLD